MILRFIGAVVIYVILCIIAAPVSAADWSVYRGGNFPGAKWGIAHGAFYAEASRDFFAVGFKQFINF